MNKKRKSERAAMTLAIKGKLHVWLNSESERRKMEETFIYFLTCTALGTKFSFSSL